MGGQSCFIRNLSDLAHLFNETRAARQERTAFCATAVTRQFTDFCILFFLVVCRGGWRGKQNKPKLTPHSKHQRCLNCETSFVSSDPVRGGGRHSLTLATFAKVPSVQQVHQFGSLQRTRTPAAAFEWSRF